MSFSVAATAKQAHRQTLIEHLSQQRYPILPPCYPKMLMLNTPYRRVGCPGETYNTKVLNASQVWLEAADVFVLQLFKIFLTGDRLHFVSRLTPGSARSTYARHRNNNLIDVSTQGQRPRFTRQSNQATGTATANIQDNSNETKSNPRASCKVGTGEIMLYRNRSK